VDQFGVGRKLIRELRVLFPGVFHSDRQILKGSKEERVAVDERFGKPIKIENGWRVDFDGVCNAIFAWMLTGGCHPAALDETETSTDTLLAASHEKLDAKITSKQLALTGITDDSEASEIERVKLEAGMKKLDVRKENMKIKKESADRNGVTSTQLAGALMNIQDIIVFDIII
jgi:hypothetical protein